MAEKAFPDIASKLNAPVRKTAYERQKEEAEAKRKREEAETAAALKEFEDSFAEDADTATPTDNFGTFGNHYGNRGGGVGFRGAFGGGLGRGNFGGGIKMSGPGSLPPPPMLGRKRGHDGSFTTPAKEKPMFAYKDVQAMHAKTALQGESDEEEDSEEMAKAAPRPTLLLQGLPVGTTQEEILSLFQEHVPNLKVDKIDISPPPAPGGLSKKSLSAIAVLGETTVGKDVDVAISALQRLYLGLGHQLSISRHLSSNVTSIASNHGSQNDILPFGARVVEMGNEQQPRMRYNMAAPPSDHGYGSGPHNKQNNAHLPSTVYVKVPTDLKQLKLINKTIEGLLTTGPEFEAALMQRPEVRSEEKWAWLFDSTSIGGVYFRWRLWYLQSGQFANYEEKRNEAGLHPPEVIFSDEAPWQVPDQRPRFERVTKVDDFLSDPEYDAEEDEYSDDEEAKKAPEVSVTGETTEAQYLNPFHQAHLAHLLARLPTSPAMLRRGDVSRVSAFAYLHAGRAVEEISYFLVANIANPLSLTDANPANHPSAGVDYVQMRSSDDEAAASDNDLPADVVPSIEVREPKTETSNFRSQPSMSTERSSIDVNMDDAPDPDGEQNKEDTSSAKLIGLYVISDVLYGCATSGVRNAWKYKNFMEKALKEQAVFEQLGRLERDMGWGKVRADRWKSRVMHVLDLWSGWSLFSADMMKTFIETFKNPPLTEEEKAIEEKMRKEREERRMAQKNKAPIFKRSSEPPESEDPAAFEEPMPNELPAEKSEGMNVDEEASEKTGEQGGKVGDVQMEGAVDNDDDGDDNEKSIFGFGGAGDNLHRAAEEKGEKEKTNVSHSLAKGVVSKGSKRPSTRDMLDR